MIAIIDYGMGNLRSVQKALEKSGTGARITQTPEEILKADKVVLPGVGAMGPAMQRLAELDLIGPIRETVNSGRPFLGICLGLQLFFETSAEGGAVSGLGLVPGRVERFQGLKVPQIGWNKIGFSHRDCPLWKGIDDGTYVYFCHSYYVKPDDAGVTAAVTDYGITYTSAVWKDNVFGVQFHPEKSQTVGLKILKNFTEL